MKAGGAVKAHSLAEFLTKVSDKSSALAMDLFGDFNPGLLLTSRRWILIISLYAQLIEIAIARIAIA